jgi:hypothetical protein
MASTDSPHPKTRADIDQGIQMTALQNNVAVIQSGVQQLVKTLSCLSEAQLIIVDR